MIAAQANRCVLCMPQYLYKYWPLRLEQCLSNKENGKESCFRLSDMKNKQTIKTNQKNDAKVLC